MNNRNRQRLHCGRRARLRAIERLEDRSLLAAFTVNSLLDTVDANPGDGIARDAAGQTSLRAAIMEANARAGDDAILLGANTYTLSLAGASEDGAATGDLDVAPNGRLTITGAGAGVTIIDAAGLDRVFQVLAFANLSISGVTIHGGSNPGGDGGGVLNSGTLTVGDTVLSGNAAGRGGGIFNAGTVTVNRTTISGNSGNGGGFYIVGGSVTISGSTISHNTSGSESGSIVGGIYNDSGTLVVNNSTVSGNTAAGVGGIFNNASLSIRNSTVAANTANVAPGGAVNGSGGIVNSPSRTATIQNTIVAGNSIVGAGSPDFSGVVDSVGNNLIGDTAGSSGWIGSDLQNVDPLLGPLANNGGPTQTHLLLAASPAIDAGNNANAPPADQRGAPFVRIFNGTIDIGAYERQSLSFVVDTSVDENDGNYGTGDLSLREAILLTNANPGRDTITGGGTITLSLGELLIQSDLAISNMTVSGNNASRVFNIAPGVSVEVSAVALSNGRAAEGGAIHNAGTLTIAKSTISNSSATSMGGGIYNTGTLTVNESTISDNTASNGTTGRGGGIANLGQLTLANSTVSRNTAASLGGGIYNGDAATLSLVDSTVRSNMATGFVAGIRGGGIYNLGTAAITRSTVSANSASPEGSSGGGIYNQAGNVAVSNSTISGNSANQTGGIFNNAELTIKNSTITANATNMFVGPPSEGSGGVANSQSGAVTLQNTIIAGNVAGTAGGTPDYFGTANSLGNNLIANTSGSSGWLASDLQNVDPRLGPLADNGGPTQTHALLGSSPAIDAGNNADAPPTDQRGVPFVRIANGVIDIGAYERQPFTFVVDTAVDETDGNYGAGDLSLREAIQLTSSNPGLDIIQFAPALAGSTITLKMGELILSGDVTITGLGADRLAISGNDTSRVFNVAAGAIVQIAGLTVRNGRAAQGGGIRNTGNLAIDRTVVTANSLAGGFNEQLDGGGIYNSGTLTITNSTVSGSTATFSPASPTRGGGIWNSGALTIRDTTVFGNAANTNLGAGLYNSDSGNTTIVRSVISANSSRPDSATGTIWSSGRLTIQDSNVSANSAGGIANAGQMNVENLVIANNTGVGISNSGNVTIEDSTISGNSGGFISGGIVNAVSGTATILRSTIADNVLGSPLGTAGAGISNSGILSVTDSTISRNSAPSGSYLRGGGIFSQSGTVTITNSTITGNSAYEGGGIYNNGVMTITSSTVTDNSTVRGGGNSSGVGGGIRNGQTGVLTIQNTIIARNRLGFGFVFTGADAFGEFTSLGNNLVGDTTGNTGWLASDLTGTTAMPLDPRLGLLANNGGPTMTHALLHGSPAIDAGNNAEAPPADQRGVARPKDGDGNGTAVVDIGAFELSNEDNFVEFMGTAGGDTFLVQIAAPGTNVQVFTNDAGVGMPVFSQPLGSLTALVFDTLGGDDRLIVDFVNGSPLPISGIQFSGGSASNKDSLIIRGDANGDATHVRSINTSGGRVSIAGRNIELNDVESIDVSRFRSFTTATANARDELFLSSVGPGINLLTSTSNLRPDITFSNIATFIIDAATNDRAGQNNDDSLSVSQTGPIPDETGFVQFLAGLGVNTLTVRNATARIDAAVAAGATLNTTVSNGGHLITHRFRQNSLTLSDGSRATILPDGTDAATSVLNSLTINAGGTLDLNDNGLIVDYTGTSPITTIRSKIIEGRGGTGIGNGKWNGTGITSSTARQANATEPDAWSVGYAENATLPLDPYTTFHGVPVDATSILIAYTRTGDANLDGLVNDDDVTIVGATYAPGTPQPHWARGDFDYNGFVDDDDVTLVSALYKPSGPPAMAPSQTSFSASRNNAQDIDLRAKFFASLEEEHAHRQRRRALHIAEHFAVAEPVAHERSQWRGT